MPARYPTRTAPPLRPAEAGPPPGRAPLATLPPSTRCEILRTLSRIVAGRWDAARDARKEARDDQA